MLPARDFRLVADLVRLQRARPLHLDELARALGVSASLLQRRLKRLHELGWVERRQETTPRGRAVFYLPVPRVSLQWVSPETGLALAWSEPGETDWAFPLVGQVPDGAARATLRRLLGRLGGEAVAIVVYGSAARGDARPDSDVDVVAFVRRRALEERVLVAAAEASLEGPRSIQARVVVLGPRVGNAGKEVTLPKVAPQIVRALREDGILVHDRLRHPVLPRLVRGGGAR